jgi:hypothetical protein
MLKATAMREAVSGWSEILEAVAGTFIFTLMKKKQQETRPDTQAPTKDM